MFLWHEKDISMFSFSWEGARNGNVTKFSQNKMYEKFNLVMHLEPRIPMQWSGPKYFLMIQYAIKWNCFGVTNCLQEPLYFKICCPCGFSAMSRQCCLSYLKICIVAMAFLFSRRLGRGELPLRENWFLNYWTHNAMVCYTDGKTKCSGAVVLCFVFVGSIQL